MSTVYYPTSQITFNSTEAVYLFVCLLAVKGGDVTDHITGHGSDQLAS